MGCAHAPALAFAPAPALFLLLLRLLLLLCSKGVWSLETFPPQSEQVLKSRSISREFAPMRV